MKKDELEELAKGWLWFDYVNSESEQQEVDTLVCLLQKVKAAGRREGLEEAARYINNRPGSWNTALREDIADEVRSLSREKEAHK